VCQEQQNVVVVVVVVQSSSLLDQNSFAFDERHQSLVRRPVIA
jgi:hypothetical protein